MTPGPHHAHLREPFVPDWSRGRTRKKAWIVSIAGTMFLTLVIAMASGGPVGADARNEDEQRRLAIEKRDASLLPLCPEGLRKEITANLPPPPSLNWWDNPGCRAIGKGVRGPKSGSPSSLWSTEVGGLSIPLTTSELAQNVELVVVGTPIKRDLVIKDLPLRGPAGRQRDTPAVMGVYDIQVRIDAYLKGNGPDVITLHTQAPAHVVEDQSGSNVLISGSPTEDEDLVIGATHVLFLRPSNDFFGEGYLVFPQGRWLLDGDGRAIQIGGQRETIPFEELKQRIMEGQ